MAKKSRWAHHGKILPLRKKEDVEQDIQKQVRRIQNGTQEQPSLTYYRDIINALRDKELEQIKEPEDLAIVKERTVILAEAMTWLDLIEKYTKQEVIDETTALRIALSGVHVGRLIEQARMRFLEPFAYKGFTQESGLDKSAKSRGVSKEEWKDRQARAMEAVKVHGRKKAPKELGISPRSLATWLKCGER